MNRQLAEDITKRAVLALVKEFSGEYSVTFKGGSYGETFSIDKFEFAEITPAGDALTRGASDLEWHAKRDGVPDILSFSYAYDGKMVSFVEYNRRSRKYPYVFYNHITGERRKCSLQYVKMFVNTGKAVPKMEVPA